MRENSTMRAAIVDDRTDDRTTLYRELYDLLCERGYSLEGIDLFSGGEALLESFEPGKYALIFLDIYMEGINGIQTAVQIRRTDLETRLVFVTTSNDFAAESYAVRADYYLLKPFAREDLVRALDVIDLNDYENQRTVLLPDGSSCLLHEIIYSEYFNHKIILHLKNRRIKKLRASQSAMESTLCRHDFFMACNRGIIVNFEYVKRIEDGTVYLEEDNRVPVSRRRAAEIRKAHAAFFFSKVRS